jgi:hypothetical protein
MSEEGTSEGSAPPEGGETGASPAQTSAADASEGGGKRKRKIDLKTRLSSVRATTSIGAIGPGGGDRASDPLSFPPPPATGSVPAPRLPGGLPAVSSPFAPPEPEKKPVAQVQTIKVEMGEEVQEARKKASRATWVVAFLTMAVGGGIGFGLGNSFQAGKAGRDAAENAGALLADVEAAQKSASELSDAIRKAKETLKGGEFPADFPKFLRDTNIDFASDKFADRKPAGLPKDVLGSLLRYANDVEKFQRQKRKVAGQLDAVKEPIEEFFAEQKVKKYKYAVVFGKTKDKQFYAQLGLLNDPLATDKTFPETFKLKVGTTEKEAVLYTDAKGGPQLAEGEKAAGILVDPETTAEFSRGGQVWTQAQAAVSDLYDLLEGKESNDPNEQADGVMKNGTALTTGLKKVADASSR